MYLTAIVSNRPQGHRRLRFSSPLNNVKEQCIAQMQSIKETSAEQTLFPTEVGPNSPVSEEVLGAVRVSGGVDGRYIG